MTTQYKNLINGELVDNGKWIDVVNPATEQVMSVYPTSNTAVFFDSTILHAGLDPTRHCRNLRVTVAFKLERP